MKFQALTSAVLCGALAVSLLAGCAAKQPASAAAQSTGQKSHLTIMGTEGWAPCDNWDEIGEYSALQILNGWLYICAQSEEARVGCDDIFLIHAAF